MSDGLLVAAVVLISTGAWLFHPGAGLMLGGLCCLGLALLTASDAPTQRARSDTET